MFKKAVLVVRLVAVAALCTTTVYAGKVHAQEGTADTPPPAQEEVTKAEGRPNTSGPGYAVEFFPCGHLYEQYLADPNRVDFGLQVLHYTRSRIPDAGTRRFDLKSGAVFGLLRAHPKGSEYLGFQMDLEAGIHSQFDMDNALDNIGWDGWYSLLLTSALTRNLSLKFGWLHDSSHVGDEYAEKYGRLRIGYTRQEVAGGISWRFNSSWRTYAEYGWGKLLGNGELQKPGRIQCGLEWQQAELLQGRYRGWYAGSDLSAMQERNWRTDVSLQTGYRIDTADKAWRFGAEWHNGRPPIGEFFQYTERYLGFGVWVDL